MDAVLVTGATGLIGSNVCQILHERGYAVRALVRDPSAASELEQLGVELVVGDITDPDTLAASAAGVAGIVHGAGLLAGERADWEPYEAINVRGTLNLLRAAGPATRVVAMGTLPYFDERVTLTEDSPLATDPPTDHYSRSKRAAYDAVADAAAHGQHAMHVIPAGTFGPAPLANRAIQPPSYNQRLALAIRGDFDEAYPARVAPFGYAPDVAPCCVLALERGEPGARYLAFGPEDAVLSTGAWLSRGCELAGVEHRVAHIAGPELDEPGVRARYPLTLIEMAKRHPSTPYFTYGATTALGYEPTPLDFALKSTLDWLSALPAGLV